jgi:hypothetical protein
MEVSRSMRNGSQQNPAAPDVGDSLEPFELPGQHMCIRELRLSRTSSQPIDVLSGRWRPFVAVT